MTQRKATTIQLVPGQDDDLIRWLERIPCGGRNATLKMTLRLGLELPQPDPQADTLQALQTEVQELRAFIARLPATGGAVEPQRLTDLERSMSQFTTWMNSINRQLAAGIQLEGPPFITAAPELSLEDRQQRESKLKKATW